LFSANEWDFEVAWFAPQSEYRPTEYLQAWVRFWFDDDLRLAAAKAFQRLRAQRIGAAWQQRGLHDVGFVVDVARLVLWHPVNAALIRFASWPACTA
jgi:CRISPR-associated protein Cas1